MHILIMICIIIYLMCIMYIICVIIICFIPPLMQTFNDAMCAVAVFPDAKTLWIFSFLPIPAREPAGENSTVFFAL